MNTAGDVTIEAPTALNCESFNGEDDDEDNIEEGILRCWECNINFTNRYYLHNHLFHHIKQPQVALTRLLLPPLKLTLKSTTPNSFEVINSPSCEEFLTFNLAELEELGLFEGAEQVANEEPHDEDDDEDDDMIDHYHEQQEDPDLNVNFSPSFASVDVGASSPVNSDCSNGGTKTGEDVVGEGSECGSIPGAEPTPPPEPSPDYPKIRIKTTGLLKEPLTITEITDDNPDGDPSRAQKKNLCYSPLEDPLKLPGTEDILSIFNNDGRAKDFGFTTSESEFMPLDRLDPDRNRSNALQLYNQNQVTQTSLANSLVGLPMEALAQQVSRLQPSNNGMHQQNVLINIQQFPQVPPQPPPYQPPHMYHHPPQPMYHQPYGSYPAPVPPTSMYYPPTTGYPQHMPPPPPQSQLSQLGPSPMSQAPMVQPPPSQTQPMQQQQHQQQQQQQQHHQQQQQQSYRQMSPRQPQPPRPMQPQQRMSLAGALRQPIPNQRQPLPRQRAPMIRARGGGVMPAMRGVRPRMQMPHNGQIRPQGTVKRSPQEIQALQAKKKRFDVLTPDKDDDDCQVICMQPKNTDGGLPQISSVQGGTSEPSESSVMHLSDSITLSVRNPQPRPQSPKKSDAKAVANILATRGITVTATAKAKEKSESPKSGSQASPPPHNLNAAVSIIPSAKNNAKSNQESQLPTVDLTDDTSPSTAKSAAPNNAQKAGQRQGLPFRCDLCPAQYPNALGLSKHRQNYHKTNSGMCEIGVPLVNLKQPGIFQKLSSLGIFNYIPLPSSGPDGMFALPVINGRNPGNVAAIGATQMLTLGPVRSIPRPQNAVNGTTQAGKIMSHGITTTNTTNSGHSLQK